MKFTADQLAEVEGCGLLHRRMLDQRLDMRIEEFLQRLVLRSADQLERALRRSLVSQDQPTFTDAIGAVRLALWVGDIFSHSPPHRGRQKTPPDRLVRMAEALCFAA
jgi:hypothetical protein